MHYDKYKKTTNFFSLRNPKHFKKLKKKKKPPPNECHKNMFSM